MTAVTTFWSPSPAKAVFERLPTLRNRDLELLLPHNWKPADKAQRRLCQSRP
jgi:hypothetical protein